MELTISDYYYRTSNVIDYEFGFVPYDGLYPLLKIPELIHGSHSPYLGNLNETPIRSRLTGYIRLDHRGGKLLFRYRKGIAYGSPIVSLYSGYFSAMGTRDNFEYLPSNLFGPRKYIMSGEVDVFAIGVVKTNNLPNLEYGIAGRGYGPRRRRGGALLSTPNVGRTTLSYEDVTILISKEKLRKTLYTNQYYTATVRNTILKDINTINRRYGVPTLDVSDEYLKNFIVTPKGVKTNSLMDTIRLKESIMSDVFSNLKKIIV